MITLPQLRPYTREGDVVVPSPNQDKRTGAGIEGIVLHATADGGNEAGTLSWLSSPESRVSCHLLVGRTGRVTRLVGDHQRAWHAGQSWWRGTSDVNSITIGIEIANRNDGEPYTDAQYRRVAGIVAHYCHQGLSLDDVVSHGAIAESRRTDPLGWDWDRFRAMVQDQLQAAELEEGSSVTYDRRSRERGTGTHKHRVSTVAGSKNGASGGAAGKPALCSRTLWLNGLTVLAAGSVIIGEILDLTFSVGLTLPDEITMWALFGMGVVNIVLRFQTTCPVGSRPRVERVPNEATVRVPRRVPAHHNGKVAAGQQ